MAGYSQKSGRKVKMKFSFTTTLHTYIKCGRRGNGPSQMYFDVNAYYMIVFPTKIQNKDMF